MIPKNEWRQILIQRRKAISQERREEAAHLALQKLKSKGHILSFSPFGSEIDLGPLNAYLKSKGRLTLVPYELDQFFHVNLLQIDCILVPGLGFDREKTRLGYGKGYYDRFLKNVNAVPTIGIGFKEQLCTELLPKDSWDIPVQELLLF